MRTLRLFVIAIVAVVSIAVLGQQFHPLGLSNVLEGPSPNYYARMHVEDNTLYVCTRQGLYAKDLSNDGSQWQLAGFEGIPLINYARCGNDILALRHNIDSCFLLLSHDGGRTYSDITPPLFIRNDHDPRVKHVLTRLVRHPDDPSTLLVLSNLYGLYRSTDFGQTWSRLAGFSLGGLGYHPARPEIIYQSGENDLMEATLSISYDSGQTWNYFQPTSEGLYAGDIAFNPSDPDKWIYGDYHGLSTSDDNGHTWSWVNINHYGTWWSCLTYDCANSDIVYAASSRHGIIYSIDGGNSWSQPLVIDSEGKELWGIQQYGDRLLVYKGNEVYEISKADLIPHNAVQNLESDDAEGSSVAYDLQGRRTSLQPKGIYIKNGKKYVSIP